MICTVPENKLQLFTTKALTNYHSYWYTWYMNKVIDTYMSVAAEANDWKLVLRYQWVLNAADGVEIDLIDGLLAAKEKGR